MHTSKLLFHGLLTLSLVLTGAATADASKRVVIDKSNQTLRAYENGHLVLKTRVSTGKSGKETPNGSYSARMKKRMHYSSRYNNAPMPYSVQFRGHYFIHGYSHVPNYPASRGCVRLPMNAAPAFFSWVTPGTPITVTGNWSGPRQPQMQRRTKARRTAEQRRPQRIDRYQRYPRAVAEAPSQVRY